MTDRHYPPQPHLPIHTWEAALPESIALKKAEAIRKMLLVNCKPLTEGSVFSLPQIPLFPRLQSALAMSFKGSSLIRGFPEIRTLLENEQIGLDRLKSSTHPSTPRRISRILLITRDASERLCYQIETLLHMCAPRLAGIVIDVTSNEIHQAVFGKPGNAKLLLAAHKNAVALVLTALLSRSATQ